MQPGSMLEIGTKMLVHNSCPRASVDAMSTSPGVNWLFLVANMGWHFDTSHSIQEYRSVLAVDELCHLPVDRVEDPFFGNPGSFSDGTCGRIRTRTASHRLQVAGKSTKSFVQSNFFSKKSASFNPAGHREAPFWAPDYVSCYKSSGKQ